MRRRRRSARVPRIDPAAPQLVAVKGADAPFQKAKASDLEVTDGMVHQKGSDPASGMRFEAILKRVNQRAATGEGKSVAAGQDPKVKGYSTHSFGAQFAEVEWDSWALLDIPVVCKGGDNFKSLYCCTCSID